MTIIGLNPFAYTLSIYFIAILTLVWGIGMIWLHRNLPGWRTALFLFPLSTLWAIAIANGYSSPLLETKLLWLRLEWFCWSIVPTVWFVYGLLFNEWIQKLQWWHFFLISITPIVVYVLFLTNARHGIIYEKIWLDIDGSIPDLRMSFGPGIWVYMIYSYSLLAIGFITIIYKLIVSKRFSIWRASLLFVIVIAPWILVLFDMQYDLKGFHNRNITALALVITNPVLIWSASRRQLGGITLHSLDRVFESLNTAVFLLDNNDRVLDLNRAGEQLVKIAPTQPKEKKLGEIFDLAAGDLDLSTDAENISQHISLNCNGVSRTFQANISLIKNWLGQVTNKVLVLSDITEHARLYERAQEEIDERMKAEQAIKESLQEKEILLKEIHHRVKNNLQIISSMLNLQSDQADNQVITAFVSASQSRISSMALIHEMLYQSENLAQVKFDDYVRKLVAHFRETAYSPHKSIRFEIDVEEIQLDIDTAIQCGLILNELVSNSVVHAFSEVEKGIIKIDFHRVHNDYALRVQDDGIGLAEDFSVANTDTLGLQLVTALVQQLGGEVSLDRSGGTTILISFDGAV